MMNNIRRRQGLYKIKQIKPWLHSIARMMHQASNLDHASSNLAGAFKQNKLDVCKLVVAN